MKKILFLITQAENGGAQKYVLELASSLQKEGYQTSVASEKNNYFQERLLENNVKFYELKHIKREINPLSDFFVFFEIYKLIKSKKPDIVHLNSSKIGLLGAVAGKLSKTKKVIFTAHGWVFNEILPFYKKWFYILISKVSALFQDEIICVSNFDKNTALKYKIKNKKKLHVIHNGINLKETKFLKREKAREALKIKKDKFVIGTIANLYKNKGIKYLIKSASEIKDKNIEFIVIGDGPERESLEDKIKSLNLKNFQLLGSKSNASCFLKAFDIFVLPSQKEGFPYALLEAGSAKIPVISTAVGGIPDLINEQNGLLIMSKNSRHLKNAILKLKNDKNLSLKISEKLFKDISENFTLKNTILKTKKIYQSA